MNKISITGSSGFLGKELIKKFKFRKVYLISKKKIKTYPEHHNIICNLTNKKKLISEIKKINPKVIYHLAWHGIPSFDKKNFKVNLKITKNLVEAINLSSCKKIIVSGTCAEYGFSKKIFYENSKKNLISPLGKQKEMTRNYLSNNLKLAYKLDLDGAYIPAFNKKINLISRNLREKFQIIGSAHNLKEIRIKELQGCKFIFISPLFKVNKKKKFLGVYQYKHLSNLTNKKTVALGGINYKNFKKLKLIKCEFFASISLIKKNGLKKIRPFNNF